MSKTLVADGLFPSAWEISNWETEALLKVHKAFFEKGVNRIVRVVGDELKATVGKIQFERTSRQSKVVAKNFNSLEDADRYLDGKNQMDEGRPLR